MLLPPSSTLDKLCRYLVLISINQHWHLANELISRRPLISRMIKTIRCSFWGCRDKNTVVNTNNLIYIIFVCMLLFKQGFAQKSQSSKKSDQIVTMSAVFSPRGWHPAGIQLASSWHPGMLRLIRNPFLRRTLSVGTLPLVTCHLPACDCLQW